MPGLYRYPLPQPRSIRRLDPPAPRPSGTTAVTAALLALPAAVAAGYVPAWIFLDMPAEFSLGALPALLLADLGGYLLAGLVLLVGAVAVLFRSASGAVLLALGGLLGLASLLLEPVANGVSLGRYLNAMAGTGGFAMIDRIVLFVLVVLVVLLGLLPATLRHLRHGLASNRSR